MRGEPKAFSEEPLRLVEKFGTWGAFSLIEYAVDKATFFENGAQERSYGQLVARRHRICGLCSEHC
jgi:hypothetical protein